MKVSYLNNVKNKLIFIFKNQTAKNILILSVFTSLVNIINFIYHILMGRILGPSEYSTLALIVSFLIIITYITSTIQTFIAKQSAIYFVENKNDQLRKLIRKFSLWVLIITFTIFFIITISMKYIKTFLNVNSLIPILMLGLIIIISSQLSIGRGVLQGTKKFIHLGSNQLLENVLKLILGIIFIYLNLKSIGAIIGIVIGLLISFIIVYLPIKNNLKSTLDNINKSSNHKDLKNEDMFRRSIFYTITMTVVFAIISYSDIVLVKHFFLPLESGYYSAINQIGKIILFSPMAIGMVILPRLSEKKVKKKKLLNTILKGLLLVSITSFVFLIFYFFYSENIVSLMFGKEYISASSLVFNYGLFMTFIALISLQLYYFIVMDKFIYLIILLFFLVEQITMLFFFHSSLNVIILILLINSIVLFSLSLFLIFYYERFNVFK